MNKHEGILRRAEAIRSEIASKCPTARLQNLGSGLLGLLLVPEDRVLDARGVIRNYFYASILTVQSGKVSEFP